MPPIFNAGNTAYAVNYCSDYEMGQVAEDQTLKEISEDELHFSDKWMETLIGIDLDFYGAESQAFKVDGVVFEVLEDPEDGYRSCLGGVLARSEKGYNFYKKPFATVRLEKFEYEPEGKDRYEEDRAHGYRLIDANDGHVWLTFGTKWYNDYYPLFIFDYEPKESVKQS